MYLTRTDTWYLLFVLKKTTTKYQLHCTFIIFFVPFSHLVQRCNVNSSVIEDAMWPQTTLSTLIQLMTCYLTAQTLPKPILSFHKRGFVAFTPAISKVVFNKTYLTKVCVKIAILKSWLHFPCTSQFTVFALKALQWRYNGRDGVSNYQPQDCFLNRLFRHRSKKTSKLRVTGLFAGNSPESGEFPAQMASNAENVSIWWRHHGFCHYKLN